MNQLGFKLCLVKYFSIEGFSYKPCHVPQKEAVSFVEHCKQVTEADNSLTDDTKERTETSKTVRDHTHKIYKKKPVK